MKEYKCEIWITHKFHCNIKAETMKEAKRKAKQIGAERKGEGEEITGIFIREGDVGD